MGQHTEKLGFFLEEWEARFASPPIHEEWARTDSIPDILVTVHSADTLIPVSPYIGGYNLNTFFGGKIYDKAGYVNLPARAGLPEEGLILTLPPYSATFLLIEGKTLLSPPGHRTDFKIYGSTPEGIWPLEGAMVRLNGSIYRSDQHGIITMELAEGSYPYRIDDELGSRMWDKLLILR